MKQLSDISTLEDIKVMVDSFYSKVRQDDLLGDIFNSTIHDRWPLHLDKMYRFWQTVLLDDHTYTGSPFAPHAGMSVGPGHFDRWRSLFCHTVDEHFSGKKADEAKWRAQKMAEMFQIKIEYYKNHQSKLIG